MMAAIKAVILLTSVALSFGETDHSSEVDFKQELATAGQTFPSASSISKAAGKFEPKWGNHVAGLKSKFKKKKSKKTGPKEVETTGYDTKVANSKFQAFFPATPAGASPATRKEMCPDPQIPKPTKRVLGCTIWDIFGEGTIAAEEQTDEYLDWYAKQMKSFKDVRYQQSVEDYKVAFDAPPKEPWTKIPDKLINADVKDSKIKEEDLPWEANGLKKGTKKIELPNLPKNPFAKAKKEIKEEDLPWEANGLKKQSQTQDSLKNLPKLPKNPFAKPKKEIKEEDLPWEVNGLKKGNKNITLPSAPKKEGEDFAPWNFDPAKGAVPME